jgi:ATP-dependent protease HslVU (ClpYQ) peptidase subunit
LTCIAGLVDRRTGDVYLGGDSAAVNEGFDMMTISQQKVFVKGQFAFGYAGEFRFGQILRSLFNPPYFDGSVSVDDFLAGEFMDELRKTAKELGWTRTDSDGRDQGGLALIGFQGRIFIMQESFDIIEPADGAASIGAGQAYALGAMKVLGDFGVPHEEAVRKALQVSEYYCSGVRAPFHIVKLGLTDGKQERPTRKTRGGNSKRNSGKARRTTRSSNQ